jgi:hypothetical protein
VAVSSMLRGASRARLTQTGWTTPSGDTGSARNSAGVTVHLARFRTGPSSLQAPGTWRLDVGLRFGEADPGPIAPSVRPGERPCMALLRPAAYTCDVRLSSQPQVPHGWLALLFSACPGWS